MCGVWIDVHFNVSMCVSVQGTQSCVCVWVGVLKRSAPSQKNDCAAESLISPFQYIHSPSAQPHTYIKHCPLPFIIPRVILQSFVMQSGGQKHVRNYSPLKTWSSAQDSDGCPGIMELTSVDWKQTERETKEYK